MSFTITRIGRIVPVLPVVQLGQYILELLGDGQANVCSVLQQGQTLISFLMVNFSRRDSAIIESFDRKNINELFHTTLNMKKALNLRISPSAESFFSDYNSAVDTLP